ncbi:SDR family oxidoreductase [bacterium]|nr:SDR family oxidoreductase [bacterium]
MMSKVIWITGAGRGIGKAIAEAYDQKENTLILSGRTVSDLEKVAEGITTHTFVYPLDVTDELAIVNTVREVIDAHGKVDILVNNAGMSQRSLAAETDTHVGEKIMDVNFFGAVHLTRALLPQFLANDSGDIVVISSLSGKFGFPQRSFYAASKHALHGYFESLDLELSKTNINVLLVCPGRINTDISKHALTSDGKTHGQVDNAQKNGMSAEKCAAKIKTAVERRKKEVYIGNSEVLMIYFKRYIPGLFRFIASRIKPNG